MILKNIIKWKIWIRIQHCLYQIFDFTREKKREKEIYTSDLEKKLIKMASLAFLKLARFCRKLFGSGKKMDEAIFDFERIADEMSEKVVSARGEGL